MKFSSFSALAVLATAITASPTPVVEKRATKMCGGWQSLVEGAYTIYHNNWGSDQATSGSQCTTFSSIASNSVRWSTSWTWAGGAVHVKSYSNVALTAINKPISAISSIPSTWNWRYTGTDIVADVSYDMWLAPSVGANNDYEIMIWVASYGGASPISKTGSPIATPTIAGHKWTLYSGPNGDTTVFSFVSATHLGDFSADLQLFFKYLTTSQGVSSSQVVTSIQAGTEPFTGSNAVFTTYGYTAKVN